MYKKLIDKAIENSKGLFIEDYVLGLGITVVKLNNGSCGVVHTFREEIFGGCSPFKNLLEAGTSAEEFIRLYDSTNIVHSSIGLATINAVLNSKVKFDKTGDIFESLNIKSTDTVALVGDIIPLVPMIKKSDPKDFYVFERRGETGKLPDWAIYTVIDKVDVLLLSSSTLINKTFFNIIEKAKTDRTALIGPSTTFCPEVLNKVKVFGGAKIVNSDIMLKIASRGGGTKNIYASHAAEKVQLIYRQYIK
jgi:uncharacterized protein (DUF4213/DUF364 family)